jgi:hypothetical protein
MEHVRLFGNEAYFSQANSTTADKVAERESLVCGF